MRSENKIFVVMIVVLAIVSNAWWYVTSRGYEHDISKLKTQVSKQNVQIVQKQLQYDRARYEKAQLEKNLADTQERLAQAAERDRARQVRASRSRSAEIVVPAPVRHASNDGVFSGALRDITEYCPTGSRTASGTVPHRGTVATLSRNIPFGTHILIEGLGEFIVEDRIGHGSDFDIFTPSCSEANRFGRQHRHVTILDTD